MAQVAERILPTADSSSSNQAIGHFYALNWITCTYIDWKHENRRWKGDRNGPLFKELSALMFCSFDAEPVLAARHFLSCTEVVKYFCQIFEAIFFIKDLVQKSFFLFWIKAEVIWSVFASKSFYLKVFSLEKSWKQNWRNFEDRHHQQEQAKSGRCWEK